MRSGTNKPLASQIVGLIEVGSEPAAEPHEVPSEACDDVSLTTALEALIRPTESPLNVDVETNSIEGEQKLPPGRCLCANIERLQRELEHATRIWTAVRLSR